MRCADMVHGPDLAPNLENLTRGPSTEDLHTFTHHILIPPAYHYVSLVAGNVATVTILEGMVTQCCFGEIVTIGFFSDIKYYYIYY